MSCLVRLVSEAATCLGSGVLGLGYILCDGSYVKLSKFVGFSTIGAAVLYSTIQRNRQKEVNERNMILITGCDSGLGYNMALYCNIKLNMYVCAACFNTNSEGAQKLLEQCDPKRFHLIELDIRKSASILHVEKTILSLLANKKELRFSYLVNNAGIMCFGEFEWQTNAMIENQINTNLFGTMNFTRSLLPLARQHKLRIINVTSHCALESLPGLSTYAATKAGLQFWNDALRVEMRKYGVDVVSFIPGSLVMSTNIVSRQDQYSSEMLQAFSDEQLDFYGEYFQRYSEYLRLFSYNKPVDVIDDSRLFLEFRNALLDCWPKATYINEPLRYKFYHTIFKYSPVAVRDWLVEKFVNMPKYRDLD